MISVFTALLLNAAMGAVLASFLGVTPLYGAIALNAIGLAAGFLPKEVGVLCEGVYKEVWTDKVIEHYTSLEQGTFLDGIPDFSQYAENDTIHLSDVAGDPDVLVDNTTYPLEIQTLENEDIAIKLSKFETKPTSITDDELYAIAFDKIKVVRGRHLDQIGERKLEKALHAMAPVKDTPETPVILTSGEVPDEDGRIPITRKDILELKRQADKLKIPKKDRRLVLCSDHVNDLLAADQKFRDQYHNYADGVISKMYGFEVYEFSTCPLFGQNLAKKAFGAVAGDGDYEASVFFYTKRMFKANGTTKVYYSESGKDPVNKRNLISFTNRFVALPQKREKACGAIVSRKYTSAQIPTA